MQAVRQRAHRLVAVVADRGDRHRKWGQRLRPDDAPVVVVLLDRGRHHPGHPDAVAAHLEHLRLTVGGEISCAQRLRVQVPQCEHVADLDAADDVERAAAVRRRVADDDVADVGDGVGLAAVAAEVHAAQVEVGLVGAADEVAHRRDRPVDDERHLARDADWPEIAGPAAGGRDDLGVARPPPAVHPRQLADLHLVAHVVAAHEQHVHAPVRPRHQALDRARERQAEELRHLLARRLVRCGDLRHRLLRRRTRLVRRKRLRLLDVGRVVGAVAVRDRVLAGVREHLELVRLVAADRAGVGLDRAEREPHAREDAHVGVVHRLVRAQHARLVGIERIRVLHDELARAHHAEARPDLVAELGLDLVEVDRQLPVAADLPAHDVGDHLLVRGADDEVALVPVFEPQHVGPHLLPAPGLLPQLGRLHDGHQHLEGARAVHLFAHDLLRAAQREEAERHPRVQAGAELPYHAGAQHQPDAGDVGFRRGFLQGGEVELRRAHRAVFARENGIVPDRPPARQTSA